MSTPRTPEAPGWVRWALRRLLTDTERRLVMAELAELHAAWSRRRGPREADRRYRRQLRHYPFLLAAHKLRTKSISIPVLRELVSAGRSLLRVPVLAVTIVLTVGLGVGGCATIFSVVETLYLRALPYPDAQRLQVIYSQEGENRWPLSAVDVLALRDQASDFAGLGLAARATRTFARGASAEILTTYAVSPEFFHVLGIPLLAGRRPTDQEGGPDAPNTTLVTLAFARSRMGSTRADGSDVLGHPVNLDGSPYDVVGVVPSDLGPIAGDAQIFPTLQVSPPTRKGPFYLFAVGRLRDGVTPDAAAEQLHAITRRLFPLWQASFQNENATWGMEPLEKSLQGDASGLVGILMGAGVLVLLIATANAAGLLLARVTSRNTELAVRAALGASRIRLAGHILAESAVLALGGGVVGVLAAQAGIAGLPTVAAGYIPRLDEVTLSGPVLMVAFLLAAGSGLVFGLLSALRRPAYGAMAADLRSGGRGAVGGRSGRRTQRALVVGQLAISMPLLAGAGLLLSSFARLQAVNPGFDTDHVVSMRLSLPRGGYPSPGDRITFWTEVLDRVSALPGVASVSLADSRPPDIHLIENNFDLEDKPSPAGSQPVVPWIFADTGYFHTLHIPLLAGRLFDARDAGAADPVVIVDQAWARRFFPGEEVVGRRMHDGGDTSGPLTTVVGVVGDVPYSGLGTPDRGVVYDPNLRSWAWSPFLYVRARNSAPGLVPSVRDVIHGLDPGVPVTEVATAEEVLRGSLSRPRNLTLVISLFSALALALAVLGLYGIMAYAVQRRRSDIAVRLTLGGSPEAVLGLVAREGMTLVVTGLVTGLAAALLVTRALSSLLYDVSPRDPLALAGASLLLLAVSAMACLLPALRAVRVNPAIILREE